MTTRNQLSLFVPPSAAAGIEPTRHLLDPIQAALIPAHVTLCREDELDGVDLDLLESRIGTAGSAPLTLKFGGPEIFEGHGVLLPCIEGGEKFHALRCCILGSRNIRRHAPHLTLAHPRNARSPHNVPANVDALLPGLIITFTHVQHIRQTSGAPWQVIAKQPLGVIAGEPT